MGLKWHRWTRGASLWCPVERSFLAVAPKAPASAPSSILTFRRSTVCGFRARRFWAGRAGGIVNVDEGDAWECRISFSTAIWV